MPLRVLQLQGPAPGLSTLRTSNKPGEYPEVVEQLGLFQSANATLGTKTLYQLLLAATVANLTLVATKTGMMSQSRPMDPASLP